MGSVINLLSHPRFGRKPEPKTIIEDRIYVHQITGTAHPYRLVIVQYSNEFGDFDICSHYENCELCRVVVEIYGEECEFNSVTEAIAYLDEGPERKEFYEW